MNTQQRTMASPRSMARLCLISLIAGLLLIAWPYFVQAEEEERPIRLLEETTITDGATLQIYQSGDAVVPIHVIQVDLHEPHIKLDAMSADRVRLNHKQSLRSMAAGHGAAAAINGDVSIGEGVPAGPQITSSRLLSAAAVVSPNLVFAVNEENEAELDLITWHAQIQMGDQFAYPLRGYNRYPAPDAEGLYVFTGSWGMLERGGAAETTEVIEVLVERDIVREIADLTPLPIMPPSNGYILRAYGEAREFVQEQLSVGQKLEVRQEMRSEWSGQLRPLSSFGMMIGGQELLLKDGEAVHDAAPAVSQEERRARSAVAVSEDRTTVFLLAAGGQEIESGLTLPQLQDVLIQLGAWQAMTLEGGSSSQMAARPWGESSPQLVNETEYGIERPIVNGIGVFSEAPPGNLAEIRIRGPELLLKGQEDEYQLLAVDDHHNPIELDPLSVSWALDQEIGRSWLNRLMAIEEGKVELAARIGGLEARKPIRIAGGEQLVRLGIQLEEPYLVPDRSYALIAVAELEDGANVIVPAELIEWEWTGIEARIEDGRLHVESAADAVARLIARYDGLWTMARVPVTTETLAADFDRIAYPVYMEGNPEGEARGMAAVVWGADTPAHHNYELYMQYDFTGSDGPARAYARFGEDGIPLDGEPVAIALQMQGNNSLQGVYAEFADAQDRLYEVELVRNLNWTGWRTVQQELVSLEMEAPIRLTGLFVDSADADWQEREPRGAIRLDDIRYQTRLPEYDRQVPDPIRLQIGSAVMAVGDVEQELEQAPVLQDTVTLAPVRGLVEAMGGELRWSEEDEQHLVIVTPRHLLSMQLDVASVVLDGRRIPVNQGLAQIGDQAMLPLRLLAESLGWRVGWEAESQSILLLPPLE